MGLVGLALTVLVDENKHSAECNGLRLSIAVGGNASAERRSSRLSLRVIRNLACARRRRGDMGFLVRSSMNGDGWHERGNWICIACRRLYPSTACSRDKAGSRVIAAGLAGLRLSAQMAAVCSWTAMSTLRRWIGSCADWRRCGDSVSDGTGGKVWLSAVAFPLWRVGCSRF